MKSLFKISILVTVLIVLGSVYVAKTAVCQIPISYRLGSIDERFSIINEEAKQAISRAEEVWEKPLEKELFVYDENSNFTINFVFDERQEFTEAEYGFREKLNFAESVNESIRAQYQELSDEYENLKVAYDTKAKNYESQLANYNQKVATYNAEGGAPPEEFEKLSAERNELDKQQLEIQTLGRNLNKLVDEINRVGQQGNLLVQQYNRGVGEYNETFGESRQFTQGDYQGGNINIYTFKDIAELELVLAHEFGHALGIGHVEGRKSIMYYLIGEQPADLSLSGYDIETFSQVCTDKNSWDIMVDKVTGLFN
ncbi:matrixin family metalloprotease [Candidatus Kaiserbacteria bacterium]|nr:matrixin family metalloprotease [Candidatus Kaiserbacteria bacterium]